MISAIGNGSIQKRTWSFIMLTCMLVLFFSLLFNTVNTLGSLSRTEEAFQYSLAKTVEQNISASLLFGHNESAQQLVDGFDNDINLLYAVVLDQQKNIFAKSKYQQFELVSLIPLIDEHTSVSISNTQSNKVLISPIKTPDGDTIGYLILASSGHLYNELLNEHLVNVSWLIVLVVVLAWLISKQLAKTLTSPILKTSAFIEQVIREKNYSLQLTTSRTDEIGSLQADLNQLVQMASTWTAELEDYSENLQQQVESRTASLVEAKLSLETLVRELEFSKSEAEAANIAKSQFLANMSHEIRTPMQGILGMTELLSISQMSVEQTQYLQTIKSSAQNLLYIINDVLDFSKIEQGHLVLSVAPHVLRQELEACISLLYGKAREKNIDLQLSFPLNKHEVFNFDCIRLSQVVVNLLGNAIKFTKQGSVRLICQVKTHQKIAEIEISVIDTGIGIEESKLSTVFGAFQQANSTTTRNFGGTGLGLSISELILSKMKGSISVDSKLGEGSCFKVCFSTVVAEELPAPEYTRTDLVSGLEIALISPHERERNTIVDYCNYWGVNCLDFSNVEQFIEKSNNQGVLGKIKAVIVDNACESEQLKLIPQTIDRTIPDSAVCLISLGNHSKVKFLPYVTQLSKPLSALTLFTVFQDLISGRPLSLMNNNKEAPEEFIAQAPVHVLVADDNLTNQDFAHAVLSRFGCTFDIVSNGVKATEQFASRSYDIVLMDCQMPEMDGYTATMSIRAIEKANKRPRTPVIALTAHALSYEKLKCKASQMDDYLSKPYCIKDLVETMNRHLAEDKQFVIRPEDFNAELVNSDDCLAHKSQLDMVPLNNIRALQRPGQENVLVKIINRFLTESEKMYSELKAQRLDNDIAALQVTAHKFKTAARSLGGKELGDELEYLEELNTDSFDLIDKCIVNIEHVYPIVRMALIKVREDEGF